MTVSVPAPWEFRLHRSVTIGQFVVLIYAVVFDLISAVGSPDGASLLAMALGTIYVIGTAAVPESWYRRRFGAEAITLMGAFLTITAITLTGGPNSPYILLSMGPPILATIYGGLRTGLMTGFLSVALLFLVTISQGDSDTAIADALPIIGLYVAFVLLVTVIRRLLEDAHRQAGELAEATEIGCYAESWRTSGRRDPWRPRSACRKHIPHWDGLNAVEAAARRTGGHSGSNPGVFRATRARRRGGPGGPRLPAGHLPSSPHPYRGPLVDRRCVRGQAAGGADASNRTLETRSDPHRGVRSARQHRCLRDNLQLLPIRPVVLRPWPRSGFVLARADARRHRPFARLAGAGPRHGRDAAGGARRAVRWTSRSCAPT